MALQQCCGINAVTFFAASIFEAAGVSDANTTAALAVGVVSVIFTVVACALVDRVGRRILLLLSAIGVACSAVLLGYYFERIDGNTLVMLKRC